VAALPVLPERRPRRMPARKERRVS
jgi:hypothetical protein